MGNRNFNIGNTADAGNMRLIFLCTHKSIMQNMKKTGLVFITLIVIYFSSIAMIKDSRGLAQDKNGKSLIKWVDQKTKNTLLPSSGIEHQSKLHSRRSIESYPRDVAGPFH